jgi:hypothetical protein
MNVSKKVAVIFGVVGLAAGSASAIALQTHAAEKSAVNNMYMRGVMPAASGSVTAVSGNTITVTDKRTNTSFTVDLSSAVISKITPPVAGTKTKPTSTTISASAIAVGDMVTVEGTISGSNIVATKVLDGMFGFRGFGKQMGHGAAGTVTAVSGNTITLTGKDGKTYTVEAGSAAVKKIVVSSVADIKVGDTLMVNGNTSGTTITAKQIVDGAMGDREKEETPQQ